MANSAGKMTVEISSVVSPEARAELAEIAKPLKAEPGWWAPAEVVTSLKTHEHHVEGSAIKEDGADIAYFRDKYPDDNLLQVFLDVVEDNKLLWEASKRLNAAGIDLTDFRLRDWQVEHHHEVNGVLTVEVRLAAINVKGGLGGR